MIESIIRFIRVYSRISDMPLEDFLIPGEEIRFQSYQKVRYGAKDYQVIVTNKRLLLYARRGTLFKKDDVVSISLGELQGVKYKEQGILRKKGILEVHGKTLVRLFGRADEMKTLYQQLMQFI